MPAYMCKCGLSRHTVPAIARAAPSDVTLQDGEASTLSTLIFLYVNIRRTLDEDAREHKTTTG